MILETGHSPASKTLKPLLCFIRSLERKRAGTVEDSTETTLLGLWAYYYYKIGGP